MNEMPLWVAIKIISHAIIRKYEKEVIFRLNFFSSFENYPRARLIWKMRYPFVRNKVERESKKNKFEGDDEQ